VRHQHEETAGQAHIGRERRALRAALLLLDLDDDFLVLAQNVLDLDLLARLGLFDEILGRDLLQGQKAVALSTVIDETGFEARLDARDAPFVDVRFALFSGRYLYIKIV